MGYPGHWDYEYDSSKDKAKGKIPFSSLGTWRLFHKYETGIRNNSLMWEICPEDYRLRLYRFMIPLQMHKNIYKRPKTAFISQLQTVTLLRMYIYRLTLIVGLPPRLTSFWIISSQISALYIVYALCWKSKWRVSFGRNKWSIITYSWVLLGRKNQEIGFFSPKFRVTGKKLGNYSKKQNGNF